MPKRKDFAHSKLTAQLLDAEYGEQSILNVVPRAKRATALAARLAIAQKEAAHIPTHVANYQKACPEEGERCPKKRKRGGKPGRPRNYRPGGALARVTKNYMS